MAVAQGYGKTVTSGSVFAYDTGDTRNSYRGEPTTNHIWHQNPRIDASYTPYMPGEGSGTITQNHPGAIRVYNENGSDISEYINTGVGDWTNQRHAYWIYDQILKRPVVRMYNENGSWQSKHYNPGIGSLTNIGVSAGTTYVISWLQYVESLDRSAYVGLYSYSNTYGYNNFWDGLQAAYNTQTHTWQRVSAIFTATNNGQLGNYHGGYTYGHSIGAGELRVADIQLEVKTHATQYSNSLTRSATQGLLPLVGNSTIDLTNVSFDSNAQMTFDGTDDTLDLGIPVTTLAALSNFSMECVVKIDNYPSAASPNGYGSTTKKGVLLGATYYSGVAFYWAGNSSGTACNVHAYIRGADAQRATGTYNLTPGSYHHLMLVNDRSNTTLSLYANGALISQVTGPSQEYNATLIPNAGNIGISKAQVDGGGTDVYSYLPVNVPVTKIYTRALSPAEVKQNYLHYKTRFNLS